MPVKLRGVGRGEGRGGKISESVIRARPMTQSVIYFWIGSRVWLARKAVKHKASDYRSGGLTVENMTVAMHCNLRPPGVVPVVLGFNDEAHNASAYSY